MQKKFIIPVLVIVFFSYFLIGNINVSTSEDRIEKIDVPVQLKRESLVEFPIEKSICSKRGYRFSTASGNVNSVGGNVQPILEITNLEERWGLYKVNFSFIDETRFPYEIYGGENLQEKLLSNEIGHDDAEFYSDNYEYYLGPGETIVIEETTPKPDSKQYWAIANINEPLIEDCKKVIEYTNVTVNKTFTEYKTFDRKVKVRQLKPIKEIIGINYIEWCIIWLLFSVIIFLIIKIRSHWIST